MKPIFFVFFLLGGVGCTDHTFPPQFKVPKESIIADIQKIISAETIQIDGFKIPREDTVLLWLNVGIINPKNLPEDHYSVMSMRKRIAVIVKNALKDPKQFKVYDVAISFSKNSNKKGMIQAVNEEMLLYDQFDVDEL
jgi:hypothetical protein